MTLSKTALSGANGGLGSAFVVWKDGYTGTGANRRGGRGRFYPYRMEMDSPG